MKQRHNIHSFEQKNHLKQELYGTSCLNSADTGRSMVEMLGVLAVIGVLSVAGIAGYRFAMNQYQANQIANELNLIRNELQIKMANGNEQLILGEPYDTGETIGDGHIAYNESYGFTYDCGDGTATPADCREEAGFYMETRDIPEGICKPLTRLVSNLSQLETIEVNGVENGECGDGNNTITLAFEADVILDGGIGGNDDEDVGCDDDMDCNGGRCNASNECVECLGDGDCDKVCDTVNGVCVECNNNADCGGRECVNNTCGECPNATPVYDELMEKCKTCYEVDTSKPLWNSATSACEACPSGQEWNVTNGECQVTKDWECRSNEDCDKKGSGYYCYFGSGYSCTQEFSDTPTSSYYSGTCRKAADDVASKSGSTSYTVSSVSMNWWSAQRFCQALGKSMVSLTTFNCAHSFCTSGCDATTGYCHADTSTAAGSHNANNVSALVKELYAAYGSKWVWTSTDYSSCLAYIVYFRVGDVSYHNRHDNDYAMCQ